MRVGAAACRECGSDAETGWSDAAGMGSDGGYADDDFDYDDYLASEFPDHAQPRPAAALKRFAIAVIVALVILGLLAPYLGW